MNKYIFLDRDGVINKDCAGWTKYGYVTSLSEFVFLPKVLEALKHFYENDYQAVIVSNQQCVGKGYLSEEELNNLTDNMIGEVESFGGKVAGVYYCVHKKEENCDCRKPKEGLFLKAKADLSITSFSNMYYVGDTERDVIAGEKSGLKTITVLTGKSTASDIEKWENSPDYVFENLMNVAEFVVGPTA